MTARRPVRPAYRPPPVHPSPTLHSHRPRIRRYFLGVVLNRFGDAVGEIGLDVSRRTVAPCVVRQLVPGRGGAGHQAPVPDVLGTRALPFLIELDSTYN